MPTLDDNENDKVDAAVITISRLFFFEKKRPAKTEQPKSSKWFVSFNFNKCFLQKLLVLNHTKDLKN